MAAPRALLLLLLAGLAATGLLAAGARAEAEAEAEAELHEEHDPRQAALLEAQATATLRAATSGTAVASSSDMSRAFMTVAPHGMTREAYIKFFVESMGGGSSIPPSLTFEALDTDRNGLLTVGEFTAAFSPHATAVHALPAVHHTTHTTTTTTSAAAHPAAGAHHTTHHTTTTSTAATAAAHHGAATSHHTTTTTTSTASAHHAAVPTTTTGLPLAQPITTHAGAITSTGATVNGVYYPPGATLPAGYDAAGRPVTGTHAYGANGGYTANGVYYPPGTSPSSYSANAANGLYASRPTKVDWYADANSKAHRTTPYRDFLGAHKVVLRRAQTFKLDLVGPAGLDFDQVSFVVGTMPVPNVGRNNPFGSKSWGCKVKGVYQNHDGHRRATYSIYLPSTAPIGEFELSAVSPQFQLVPLGTFVVVFNAWSKFDDVYLKDATYRTETTYADSGRIWHGDAVDGGEAGISSAAWNFHQYELLHIVLKIVREFVPPHDRHDVVKVARVFTWVLNNAGHDRGVLEGRWDGRYSDGVKPTAWSGSREIFQRWAQSGRPVKYGQCWVFAGILTSAMRSLGIPCRPVTNFRSAHDSAPYDHVIETAEGESVWNFHVWNEVWARRSDLRQGYQWNAIDATPQEISEGKYQMGPAAIYDVRHNRDSSFDTGFVASEVNAHVWLSKADYVAGMSARTTDFDTQDVGRFVSTKLPGCVGGGNACRLDLTKQYKANADPFTRSRFAEIVQFEHLFASRLVPERPVAGQPFTVQVSRSNLVLDTASTVQVELLVESVSYTGLPLAVVKRVEQQCTLTPNPADPRNTCKEFMPGHSWNMVVTEADVRAHIGTSTALRATVRVVHIHGEQHGLRQYVWFRQFAMVPGVQNHMAISAPSRVAVGQPFQLGVHVRNPLHYPMTGVTARLDSPDMDRTARFGNIPAHGRVKLVTKPIVISSPGVHQISVSLDTNEYPDLFAGFTLEAYVPEGGYKADKWAVNNLINAHRYSGHVYDYYGAKASGKENQYDKSSTGYFQNVVGNMYAGDSYQYKAPDATSSRVAKFTKTKF